MNIVTMLVRRLAERRFLRDGGSDASLLPNALATLSFSTLLGTMVLDEVGPGELAVIASVAVFCWSLVRAILEAGEFESDAVDLAILTPLPVSTFQIASARATVASLAVLVDALNLTLPIAVMSGIASGLRSGLSLFAGCVLSIVCAVAIAGFVRRGLRRVLAAIGISDSEGPIRLAAMLVLFVAIVRAPDVDVAGLASGPLRFAPPIVFPLAILDADGWTLAAATSALLASALVLYFARPTAAERESAGRASRPRWTGITELIRRTIREPTELAGFDFALAGIRSDRIFRARALPLLAFPFASVVLASVDPSDRSLVPMALFGATVYLVLAESFLLYSESAGGPEMLATLPIDSPQRFRLGGEKAYVASVVLPAHFAISFGIGIFDVSRGAIHDFIERAALGIVAALTSTLIVLVSFERVRGLPFATADRGLYSEDLSSGAFLALLLSTLAALASLAVVGEPWKLALFCGGLLLMIRLVHHRKHIRCLRIPSNP